VQLSEDLPLVHDGLDTALGEDPSLVHLLHGVLLLGLLPTDFPHLSESSFTNAVMVLK